MRCRTSSLRRETRRQQMLARPNRSSSYQLPLVAEPKMSCRPRTYPAGGAGGSCSSRVPTVRSR
jgi:hypothetical protein